MFGKSQSDTSRRKSSFSIRTSWDEQAVKVTVWRVQRTIRMVLIGKKDKNRSYFCFMCGDNPQEKCHRSLINKSLPSVKVRVVNFQR